MEKRSVTIRFRVTPDERVRLGANAAACGLGVSEYVRRTAIEGHPSPVIVIDMEPVRRTLANLQRIGGNLNQLARLCNAHGMPADATQLRQEAARVAGTRREVMGLVRDIREGRLNA